MTRPFEHVGPRLRLRSSKAVRRRTTSRRKSTKSSQDSSRFKPAALVDDGQHDDAEGVLQRRELVRFVQMTWLGSPLRMSSTMRMPSRELSSRMSAIPSMRFLAHQVGEALHERALFTW